MADTKLQPLNKTLKGKAELPVRVLQFGEGNFLRAFVDWIIHRMNKELNFNAGVTIVQPIAQGLAPLLNAQDGLYTLYLNGLKNGQVVSEHELIECVQQAINPYENFGAYLKEAENPDLRFIISNTTEAGITYDETDAMDVAPPNTFPAKLTVFLFHRFSHFRGAADKGCIIIPCELIDRNGDKLKVIIEQYADLWDLGNAFLQWVENHCIFCNTLVDRIVPGYPRDRIESIWQELGYHDQLVAEGEQFHLWVIEAPKQVAEEFPAHKAGLNVLFTDDMAPYRTRKVRILNGAHTSMVPVAYLYGIETVKEAVEDDTIGPFIKKLVFDEIIPTLDLPEEELQSFANDVMDRFKNPFIKHYLISISLNSTSKYETRVLPSLLEFHKRTGKLPRRIVFALAALIRFYKGEANGKAIPLQDDADRVEFLQGLWYSFEQKDIDLNGLVGAILKQEDYWGADLREVDGLQSLTTIFLGRILDGGIAEGLKAV
jgi:tagaturonate reductase